MSKNLVELQIPQPDGDAGGEALTAVKYAADFKIACAADSLKAQEARARLNAKIKVLNDARLALTRPIDAAKQKIMDFFKGPAEQFTQAKAMLDAKIIAWDNEQERLRREEQRRQEEIAAAERRRIQQQADEAARKAREEAEAKRKEADRLAAEGRAAEAAKLNAQAARVEAKADAKVESLEQRAAAVVAPVIQSEIARASGVSTRENWTFRIADASKINPAFLMPDEAKIGKVVKSMKGDAAVLIGAGVEVFPEKVVASRRA